MPGGGAVVGYLFLGSALPVQLFLVPLFFLWTQLAPDRQPARADHHLLGDRRAVRDAAAALVPAEDPQDFTEAARLDGASSLQIAWRVVLPLAWPGFLTVALIVALWSWNEFFWAITFIHTPELRPVSTSFLAFQDQNSTDWGLTSAAAIFMLAPRRAAVPGPAAQVRQRPDLRRYQVTRPNVILVIADQLRRAALGCYGDPNVSTPHIDALAGAGTRFDAASSTYPVCVPYRFTLMTGEYAHTRFIPSIEWRMSPAERTLADELNDAGYTTALFGKWHLYGNFGHYPGHNVVKASRTPVPRPFQGRFERFGGFDICNDPWDTYYWNEDDPTPHKIDGFQTDGLFDLAIEHLGRVGDRPFATVLSVEPPHPIFTALSPTWSGGGTASWCCGTTSSWARNTSKRGPHGRDLLDDLRVYYAMIENLDDNIGRLVAALRANGSSTTPSSR